MPSYDYLCATCGPFNETRPMSEAAEARACPGCGQASSRAILAAPRVGLLSAAQRGAHATNERSRHAPRSLSGGHAAGCSCCSGLGRGKTGASSPEAAKGFVGKRPWMISH